MKIALPTTKDNLIDGHFGHCEFYSIYTISDNNEIVNIQTLEAPCTCGCKSNIASTLANMGVTIMLAGGMGDGAVNVLNASGISVVRGCSGNVESVVKEYIEGRVKDSGNSCNHDHSHGSNCNH
jgi:predicted Fe-Mo cluster-binding NifX family protein